MPSSKKGRLSGSARKEINKKRSSDAVNGNMEGIIFARVSRILGANHVMAMFDTMRGPRELRARIPNIFSRRGATPITTRDVVAIEVGREFDPDDKDLKILPSELFDIKAILNARQVYSLQKDGEIPEWMGSNSEAPEKDAGRDEAYEFDYSAPPEEEDERDDKDDSVAFSRKEAIDAANSAGDDFDIDAI